MTQLYIATPMYGGQCSGLYTQSMLALAALLQTRGVPQRCAFIFNESLITRARNALVHSFLRTDATHLLFIDADIGFQAEDVPPMLAAGLPVLCGLYPKKMINWDGVRAAALRGDPHLHKASGSYVVNLAGGVAEATVPVNQPVEIVNGGTGFMLIERGVFEALTPQVPGYLDETLGTGGRISEFFATSIEPDTGRLLSEDYHFCQLWRRQGGRVHAAPWVRLAHVGTQVFEGELARS